MDFATAPATAELCSRVRTFVDEELVPLEPTFLGTGWAAVLPALERVRARVQELGWRAPQLRRPGSNHGRR